MAISMVQTLNLDINQTNILHFFQTGDKWRHLAGFNDLLKQEENFHWLVLSFTIALIGLMILHREKLSLLCYSLVFIQKLADVFAER